MFYQISFFIIIITLINFFLISRQKNNLFRKVGFYMNLGALLCLIAAIIFKAFNE